MTLRQALDGAARQLGTQGEDDGRGEAEQLLGRLLACSRAELYLRGGEPFDTGTARTLALWILRRRGGEPLQSIVGEAAYRDLVLEVGPGVFIPRPETELLVEHARAFLLSLGRPQLRVLECGTGSGAIALALASELPDIVVVATELSPRALAYANRNRGRLLPAAAARVHLVQGDLVSPVRGPFDALLSNPPYIAEFERAELPRDVLDHEPHLALFAARDGMAVIERLVDDGARVVAPGGLLALELGSGQGDTALALLATDPRWTGGRVERDLAGRARMLLARRAH
ncbi:MAG: peptide chain release factor N(5)-glutamine methyltransferase [Candidatus Eisenbacteria bacterium]